MCYQGPLPGPVFSHEAPFFSFLTKGTARGSHMEGSDSRNGPRGYGRCCAVFSPLFCWCLSPIVWTHFWENLGE